jgi:UDP-N-acetylmuramate--alanine ligase
MEKVLSGIRKIYLIGIGGVGMSGLALLLKEKGFLVLGSDLAESFYTKILQDRGIRVFIGHSKDHISCDIDLLAFSSAVKDDNPELEEAKRRNISILKRGELLAKLCKGKKTVAVAGSHGKTTTTSLLGYLLTSLGYKPAVFLGGTALNYSCTAWWGDDYFVIETDESDGSFLYCNPWISIITNIDCEHIDHYKTIGNLRTSFLKFARQTKDKVFGWGDHSFLSEIVSGVGGLTFGWGQNNMVRADNFRFDGYHSCFDLYINNKFANPIKSPLLGKHNCLNVLAVFAFFSYLGEDLEKIAKALLDFKGTKRRFQIKEKVDGVTFVDDYAHHPTEIRAVLSAAKLLGPKRVVAILQPHRFSRIKLLYEEFSQCFGDADELIITDIYSAHEKDTAGLDGSQLTEAIGKNFCRPLTYIAKDELSKKAPYHFKTGDLVLALGAGDINILLGDIINEFKRNRVKI